MSDTLTQTPASGSNRVQLHYSGSKGWLIFWLIVLFPIGLTLLFTSGEFESDGRRYFIRYPGSRGWLCFWSLVCFPIAIILLLLNGLSIHWGEVTSKVA
jgi:hypothetical protein